MTAQRLLVAVTVLLAASLCLSGTALNLVSGFPRAAGYISRFWPVKWSAIPGLLPAALDTLAMSFYGTSLALVTAVPLALLATRNLAPSAPVYLAARVLAALSRASPVVVLGILFVAAVGLGATAGVMGIWFHTVGVFCKYFSEAFEAANWEVIEAAAMDGASRWQAYVLVLVPMEANTILSFLLYYFEANFRQATFLSVVGAGGIGVQLSSSIGQFDYGRTGAIVVLILATALVLDLTSRFLRSKVL